MELSKFIETSLLEICKGIKQARSHEINKNSAIAPSSFSDRIGKKTKVAKIREIEFSVFVKTTNAGELQVTGEGNASIGCKAFARGEAKGGVENKKSDSNEHCQSIKFCVPYLAEALSDK